MDNEHSNSNAPVTDGSAEIEAVPVRHPGRWIATTLVVILFALLIKSFITNPNFEWGVAFEYFLHKSVLIGLWHTIELTIICMVIGIAGGVVIAVMRLSPNPVLSTTSWLFIWFFRGTPLLVQIFFWGSIGALYKTISIGIPFGGPHFATYETQTIFSVFFAAILGLALNEVAYMAEIVRAGLLAVENGQTEASTALGMSWGQTMRKVVLPQAMRVIIPPTGNEVISMLKTTSLVIAVPLSTDLYTRSRDISAETLNLIPLLLVASVWYLTFTSTLMVGQYFLERRFSRGHVRRTIRGTRGEGKGVTKVIKVVPAFGADTGENLPESRGKS